VSDRQRQTIGVGTTASFPVGHFVIMKVAGREIGVVRLASGEMRAVRNRCPHKGAPICRGIVGGTWPPSAPDELKFDRAGEVLVCPWHGWEYDLTTGEEMFQPRPSRLLTYPVTVRDGEVFVTI